MKIEFDTEDIKTEQTFAGYFFMLTKIGEKLMREVRSESLTNLVLTLVKVKENYLGRTDADLDIIYEGVDEGDDEIEG